MANPSKRYPWIIQMYVKAIENWINVNAYKHQTEAEAGLGMGRKLSPEAEWRLSHYDTGPWRSELGQ